MKDEPLFLPVLIVSTMLLAALYPWPYGYYQLLRWATCGAAIFVSYNAYLWKHNWAIWVFSIIAVLFNPIAPIHLSRETWQPIDVVCAIIFIVAAVILKKNPSENT